MTHLTTELPTLTIGIDLGDRFSHACGVDATGEVTQRERLTMTLDSLQRHFGRKSPLTGGKRCRVIIEAGTHSPWVSEVLAALGHEIVVANPRTMVQVGGGRRRRKNDKFDAEALARIGRLDVNLLHPIRHRGREARIDLSVIRARAEAVSARTGLINTVRGQVKTNGARLLGCSTAAFHIRVPDQLPDELKPALMPLVEAVAKLTETIKGYDRLIDELAVKKYPDSQRLAQVTGVGNLTALTYVLTLEDHRRFAKSRSVGAFLGLVARQHQSGDEDPELRISKAGDSLLRRLLVTAAHYILGPMNREDSDLRRFGSTLTKRGRKNARKRAVVAVARRLAVLLHALWRSGERYDPLRNSRARMALTS